MGNETDPAGEPCTACGVIHTHSASRIGVAGRLFGAGKDCDYPPMTEAAERAAQITAAEAMCARANESLTPLRRRVFELLLDRDGPAKAYDLLDELKTTQGSAKPPTVYRALDFLVRLGLAHRIESLNAFVACDIGSCERSTIFLICDKCGASVEIDSGHALADVSDAAKRIGFQLKHTVLEASGLCAQCAAAA